MLPSKTKAAFLMTCQKLSEEFDNLYCWTFTFVDVYHAWRYPYIWAYFIRDLSNLYGGMLMGVKVIESHREHGYHYHCVFNMYLDVRTVKQVGARWGIGRVHVMKLVKSRQQGWFNYLAEYLTKETDLPKGMRRWGTVGGYTGVKKNNLQGDSVFHRNKRKLKGVQKLDYRKVNTLYRASVLWGAYRNWSAGKRRAWEEYTQQGTPKGRKEIAEWALRGGGALPAGEGKVYVLRPRERAMFIPGRIETSREEMAKWHEKVTQRNVSENPLTREGGCASIMVSKCNHLAGDAGQ